MTSKPRGSWRNRGPALEDADQVAQALDQSRAFAPLFWIVEVGEVAAGEAGVGIDEWLDNLRVDLVADVALALEGDHVLEAGALGDVTGGANLPRVWDGTCLAAAVGIDCPVIYH